MCGAYGTLDFLVVTDYRGSANIVSKSDNLVIVKVTEKRLGKSVFWFNLHILFNLSVFVFTVISFLAHII